MDWLFFNIFSFVMRRQYGALYRSPSQTLFIERKLSYHLGYLHCCFESKLFVESKVDNMDEKLFTFKMRDNKMISCHGTSKLNCAKVVTWCDWLLWFWHWEVWMRNWFNNFLFSKIEIEIIEWWIYLTKSAVFHMEHSQVLVWTTLYSISGCVKHLQ